MGTWSQDSSPIIHGYMYRHLPGLIWEEHETGETDYANAHVASCAMSNKVFVSDPGVLGLLLAFMTLS